MIENDITKRLQSWREGDAEALEDLIPLIYTQLRQLAAGYLHREREGHTLQPTALVNEVYLRLVGGAVPSWTSRKQFYAIAARLMRQILVDHARREMTGKRGSGQVLVELDDSLAFAQEAVGFTVLDQALEELAKFDERKARVIELRFLVGLSVEETADVLEVSAITVQRDLRFTTAWLAKRLNVR